MSFTCYKLTRKMKYCDNSESFVSSATHDLRELEYRNKILQFKWEILRKRFIRERLWQATTVELEALEACYWLKATGFSSYVKMYEEKKFPIDLGSTGSCNKMLDGDSLQSLIKRLETLNKCAKLLDQKNSDSTNKSNENKPWNSKINSFYDNKPTEQTALETVAASTNISSLDSQNQTIESIKENRKPPTNAATTPKSLNRTLSEQLSSTEQQTFDKSIEFAGEDFADQSDSRPIFKRAFSFPVSTPCEQNNNNVNGHTKSSILKKDSNHSNGILKEGNSGPRKESSNFQEITKNTTRGILKEPNSGAKSSNRLREASSQEDIHPHIVIEVQNCDLEEEKTAAEIIKNIRNSIYDNVPNVSVSGCVDSGDTMLNKTLPSDVKLTFDNNTFYVTDLEKLEEVSHKINENQRHTSSEDDDDDVASVISDEEGDEIEDEVESLHHLDIPGSMSHMKKMGMGSVDSGVPSSPVLRSPSVRKRRVRWHSFQKSYDRESMLVNNKIMSLSAGQLNVLKKLSLLRLTALLERYSCNNRTGWHWTMPKLLKKFKAPDYKDKNIFGVPLLVIAERTGNPLPHPILLALNHLSRLSIDSIGIFRRSGMKSRIDKLRNQMENTPDKVSFDEYSVYDVADTLKQYFRELPEPLLTTKLVDTFISIHKDIPKELRLQAMQLAIILMPDENRDLLQTVLMFLSDVASHSYVNQMTEKNLATCFVPAFFHLCSGSGRYDKNSISAPKKLKRSTSVQCQKELDDTIAAQECLSEMMKCVRFLFSVPDDVMMKSQFNYIEAGEPVPLEELGRNTVDPGVDDGYNYYLDNCFASLLQETSTNSRTSKKWVIHSDSNGIVLSYRKINDGYPLRLWRSVTEIMASPEDILKRIVKERHLWDDKILHWEVLERLDENTDVFHYETQSVAPSVKRDFVVLRSWKTNLTGSSCGIVMTSIKHKQEPPSPGVRGTMLACRCLIEPIGLGRSRITYIARIDLRGRSSRYYNKAIAPRIMAAAVREIRESFNCGPDGPETNV